MSTVAYDAAILIAADNNQRRAWAEHKARLEFGFVLFQRRSSRAVKPL